MYLCCLIEKISLPTTADAGDSPSEGPQFFALSLPTFDAAVGFSRREVDTLLEEEII